MKNLLTKYHYDCAYPSKTSCLLLVLAVFCLVFGKIYFSEHAVFLLDHAAFRVISPSMEPDYPINSIVVIKKCDFSTLKVGDNIAFRSRALNGKIAFHRIVAKTDRGFITKGDNNKNHDNQLITKEDLVGKEAFSITFHVSIISTIVKYFHVILSTLIAISATLFLRYTLAVVKD